MVILLDQGYDNLYSKLETLIYLKFATFEEKGAISFRFKAYGIETKTFKVELDEDGKEGRRNKNPSITSRWEWLAFYEAHKEDFDSMWTAAMKYMFSVPELGSEISVEDDEDVEGLTEED